MRSVALSAAGRAREAARILQGILDAVRRGELTAPPGLVARLEGALAAFEAVAEPPRRRRRPSS
jgi:hypothetical protein